MTREEAIRKAASLLRLSRRPGTAGEAAAAAAAAARIIEEWRFSSVALEEQSAGAGAPTEAPRDFSKMPGGEMDRSARLERWRCALANPIAQHFGCFVFNGYRDRGRSVEIVGPPESVEMAREVYSWVRDEARRLVSIHGRGMGATWRNSFLIGIGLGVRQKLAEMRAAEIQAARERERQAGNSERGLVLIESAALLVVKQAEESKAAAYRGNRLTNGRSSGRTDLSAREAGRAMGRNLNVTGGQRRLGGGL